MNTRLRFLLSVLFLLALSAHFTMAENLPNQGDAQGGGWHVRFTPGSGVALWFHGVPVTTQSTVYFVKPGWTGVLYDCRAGRPTVTVQEDQGDAVLTVHDASDSADVTQNVTLSSDGTATTDLAYALRRDVPGEIEYAAGYLSAPLMADDSFQAVTADGPRQGTVPIVPASADEKASEFLPSFRALTLQTRMGTLQINVSGDWPDFVCFDARKNTQSWAQDAPIFWMGLGVTAHPLHYEGGRTFHVITRYHFAPSSPVILPLNSLRSATFPVTGWSNARVPITPLPVVIPQPKHITLSGERLRLDSHTRLVIADHATSRDREAALAVQSDLCQRFGLNTLPIVSASKVRSAKDVIVFGEPARVPWVARLLARAGAIPATKAEGYTLRFGQYWAVVAGHDPAGTYYGAQTLCELLALDTKGPFVWKGAVDDYPALAWRGAHLFVGNHALPFHEKLIQNVFARAKLNNLVLQCEQARWDTIGKAAPPWAMSKTDLRHEVTFAHQHFLEVTPLVESVGHMEWLFQDPKYIGLAEDPQTPYAIDASNPATYRFLDRFYDEVIALFHPRCLHIGGDEVTLRGRYPFRSAAQYPTVADAYDATVTHAARYLRQRGVGTMMWGDMMLAPGEATDAATNAPTPAQAAQMRAALPKDIVITDWHYEDTARYPSPALFRRSGFQQVIGATWMTPDNIAGFNQSLNASHQWGLLQTTWVGFDSSAQNLTDDPSQFTAFVLAGDYAWSGRTDPPTHLPYDPARVFASWYAPTRTDPRTRPGFTVALDSVANRALADSARNGGWLGYGPSHDLGALPNGTHRMGDMLYDIGPRAVLLAGAFNSPVASYPQQVHITLNRCASTLSLVLGTAFMALRGTPIGKVCVTYMNGTMISIPLIYGRSIAAWDDPRDAPGNRVIWKGQCRDGTPILLRALEWNNPHPLLAIRSLTLTAADPAASPVLFALTGLRG
jgi:hexosaminidase